MNKIVLFSEKRIDLTLLEDTLKKLPITFFSCTSLEEFSKTIEQEEVDLIFFEVVFSNIDRFRYLNDWMKDHRISQIPIMIISDISDAGHKVRAFESGAVDYIVSPFNAQECVARMNTHLKIRNMQNIFQRYSQQLEDMVNERIIEIEETRNVTIFALAKLAESRDPETGKHLERISHYSKILAEHLRGNGTYKEEIDEQFVEHIFRCSPLHDIGKVGIPDQILLKPGKLTAEEFDEMKTHTIIGGQTLEESEKHLNSSSFLRMGRDIAYFHHEKFNGEGYPYGLKAQEIPLSARIVALADAYDALTSKRVYKPIFPHEKSKAIILEGNGTHFDPMVVEAFLSCEDQFIKIKESFKDE